MTWTQTTVTIKDSAGNDKPVIAYTDGTNFSFAHPLLDNTGAIIAPATSGNQATANTSLATIATNLPAKGAAVSSNSLPVVIASDQAALPLPTGAATSAAQNTGNTSLAAIATSVAATATNTSGLATATAQTTANTSLAAIATSTAAIASAASTEATAAKQDTGNTSLATIATNTTGVATAANQATANTTLAAIQTACQAATPAGTNMIGAVTSPGTVHLTAAPAVTAGAYTTGMVVGGLISLTGAARVNAGSGTIQSALVSVKTNLTAPFDILFFDTNPSNSTFTDNAALAINVADLPSLVGIAHCVDLVSGGTPQILQASNVGIPFKLSAANTTLYAVIVMRGAETLASTSAIGLSVVVYQD